MYHRIDNNNLSDINMCNVCSNTSEYIRIHCWNCTFVHFVYKTCSDWWWYQGDLFVEQGHRHITYDTSCAYWEMFSILAAMDKIEEKRSIVWIERCVKLACWSPFRIIHPNSGWLDTWYAIQRPTKAPEKGWKRVKVICNRWS